MDAVDGSHPSEGKGAYGALRQCQEPHKAGVLADHASGRVEPQDSVPAGLAAIERRPEEGSTIRGGTGAGGSLEPQDADGQEVAVERKHDPLGPVEGQPANRARRGPWSEASWERMPPAKGS
jgi:hypothetical protein